MGLSLLGLHNVLKNSVFIKRVLHQFTVGFSQKVQTWLGVVNSCILASTASGFHQNFIDVYFL